MTRSRVVALAVTAAAVVGGGAILAPAVAGTRIEGKPRATWSGPQWEDQPAGAADRSHLLIGGRAKFPGTGGGTDRLAAAFERGSQLAGPWEITRTFHRTLPEVEHPITPDGVVEIASYKTPQSNLASFVKSMRPQDLIAWWHEPEGPRDGWAPADYRTQFVQEYKTAHEANPDVKFGQISGGYQWRAGNRGAGGGYLPPKGSVDWLGFDTYRTGTDDHVNAIVPLRQLPEFQAWYKKAKTYDVPLYITEYGRGVTGVPGAAAKRAAVLPQDVAYLKQLGFSGIVVWYSNEGPNSKSWRFTDEPSLKALRSLARDQR